MFICFMCCVHVLFRKQERWEDIISQKPLGKDELVSERQQNTLKREGGCAKKEEKVYLLNTIYSTI
ncbi:hypothetical protein OESDEN_04997 [Oesophagostomum dentatum]|uniref:Uncharacterized protein n=1 Tax=Oesophagostomum dentatum TaxID=61180 RepID=A0A0B1TBZ1_OESDE|nr:hypothetical protein OESDEN_04997 [Oesophagostomum dentatum]